MCIRDRLLRLVLLALAVRDFNQRLGGLAVFFQERSEFGRRIRCRHHGLMVQVVDELRIFVQLDEDGVDLVDDRRRCAFWRRQAPPALSGIAAEAGLGGYPGQGWWGLAAPKGTPPAIVNKINAIFVKLYKDPKFVDYLNHQAVVAAPNSPAEFAAFLKEDRKAAEALIKIANSKREEYKPEKP